VGTLKPVPEESVNFETTENLFIEGDNLEVFTKIAIEKRIQEYSLSL
jgi:hypothetical protein